MHVDVISSKPGICERKRGKDSIRYLKVRLIPLIGGAFFLPCTWRDLAHELF